MKRSQPFHGFPFPAWPLQHILTRKYYIIALDNEPVHIETKCAGVTFCPWLLNRPLAGKATYFSGSAFASTKSRLFAFLGPNGLEVEIENRS